jgi:hypothetical protein
MTYYVLLAIGYVLLCIGGASLGYFSAKVLDAIKRWHERNIPASRISFAVAHPIIDEWATAPGREWYWGDTHLRHFAENEFARQVRADLEAPIGTILERVEYSVMTHHPEARNWSFSRVH